VISVEHDLISPCKLSDLKLRLRNSMWRLFTNNFAGKRMKIRQEMGKLIGLSIPDLYKFRVWVGRIGRLVTESIWSSQLFLYVYIIYGEIWSLGPPP
jgi:hypothetical protein